EAPLLGTLLLGTLIYLILKIIWADLPVLYNWYRRPLRRYLDTAPRGDAWFSILESFHALDTPTFLTRGAAPAGAAATRVPGDNGATSRRLPEFLAPSGPGQTARPSVLERFSRVLTAHRGSPAHPQIGQ